MKSSTIALLLLPFAAALGACGGDGGPGPGNSGGVAAVVLTATDSTVKALGAVTSVTARAFDGDGRSVTGVSVTWDISAGALELAGPTDGSTIRLRSVANGETSVTATIEEVSSAVTLSVRQEISVVNISVDSSVVDFPGNTAQYSATFTDSRGNVMQGGPPVWSSSTPSIATVDSNGLVAATGFGRAIITASVPTASASADFEVLGDRFFRNGSVRLRYDLDLPDSSGGPFPAVVWIHGSGMLNRNSQRLGTDPLVPRGLAALRYDKRGVGQSTGTFFNPGDSSSMATLASDAAAAVRFLKNFPEIDTTRIGVFGNSQGGWIAPLAAATTPEISYMMMWSGTTVSVGLEIFYSSLAEGTQTPLDSVYPLLGAFAGNPLFDPRAVLESLDIPGLWILGGMDRSIPSRLDSLNIRRWQAMGKPYEFIWYPFARHDLRDSRTNQFFPVWDDYEAWLRRQGIL